MQILALKNRIVKVIKAIEKTKKNYPERFISKNKWSLEMCDKELSGEYGNTYLYHYYNCLSYR
jgi:hypothetical protein